MLNWLIRAAKRARRWSSLGCRCAYLAVVYLEVDDPGAAFKLIGTCDEPFGR